MMNPRNFFFLFVGISFLTAFVAGGFALSKHEKNELQKTNVPQGVSDKPLPWPMYTSATFGFSIQHPIDVTVQEREDGIQLYKWGPTQKEGTEFYDGIGLFFSTGLTNGKSIKEIAERKVEEDKIHATIVKPLSEITINNIKGYQYRVSGIGEFINIILPKSDTEYLHITNGTMDPTKQGFDKIADQILSTFTILK